MDGGATESEKIQVAKNVPAVAAAQNAGNKVDGGNNVSSQMLDVSHNHYNFEKVNDQASHIDKKSSI